MTKAQEAHLEHIKKSIAGRTDVKYTCGQASHGGNLWDRAALPEAINEVTDLNTYLITLEGQVHDMVAMVLQIKQMLSIGHYAEAQDMLDRLDTALRNQIDNQT